MASNRQTNRQTANMILSMLTFSKSHDFENKKQCEESPIVSHAMLNNVKKALL